MARLIICLYILKKNMKLTLTDITSGFTSTTTQNANNGLIENAIENTLSLDGVGDNAMQSTLDMNSNRIINLAAPINPTDAARLMDIAPAATVDVVAIGINTINGFTGTIDITNPAIPKVNVALDSLNGILKGNTSSIASAVPSVDYITPSLYASTNGLTMSSGRLLGRSSASVGAAEEIVVGSGLTLSSGTLTSATGAGTVTNVSVNTANGFAGSVGTSDTTPAITISTTVTGLLLGNGTTVSAASTTGSGNVVYSTSPTLVTPTLGIATGTSLALSGDISANGLSRKNLIINGSCAVWQRGTSLTAQTTTNFYTPDRYGGNRAGDVTGQDVTQYTVTSADRTASGRVLSKFGIKWQRTSGNASTAGMYQYYALESVDSISVAGKTITLSLEAKAGANYSGGTLTLQVNYGTGTDQRNYSFTGRTNSTATNANLTTSMQRFSNTFAIPTTATEVGFQLIWTPTGTAGADDSVYFTNVQLEVGSVPTDFEFRHYETELALCQRYYYRVFPNVNAAALTSGGWVSSTTNGIMVNTSPIPMRIPPTTLEQSGTATDYRVIFGTTTTVCSSVPTFNACTVNTFLTNFIVASGLTVGQGGYGLDAAASSAGYLGWSAEL